MPTATTSQILGFNEAFEPFTSNIYKRKTLAGEFVVVNKYLVSALLRLDLWDIKMKERIIAEDGSIQVRVGATGARFTAPLPALQNRNRRLPPQNIADIPAEVRAIFKTVWEMKQKTILDMALQRAPFVCQSQSMNVFMSDADYNKVTTMHFYGWRNGLKTGLYYLRTRNKASAQKFTIEPEAACSRACTGDVCLACGS